MFAGLINPHKKHIASMLRLVIVVLLVGLWRLPAYAVGTIDAAPTTLYFSTTAGTNSGNQTITVRNTDANPLTINSTTVSGVFTIVADIADGTVIAPGGQATMTVRFNPAAAPGGVGVFTGAVTINSSDSVNPSVQVALRGIGTTGSGGSNEPSLQRILDARNIPISVGDDNAGTTVINSDTNAARSTLLGEEVRIQAFEKAGPGNVTIQPLAYYGLSAGTSGNPNYASMGWHVAGDVNNRTYLFGVNGSTQTISPSTTGTLSFDPGLGTQFAMYAQWHHQMWNNRITSQQDNQNTFTGAIPHQVRVYPNKNPDGTYVPNSYILAYEENTSGYDYNDIVFVVNNVKLATSGGGGIRFENRDWSTLNTLNIPELDYLNTWLTMSRIQSASVHQVHHTATLRIHNDGSTPLDITGLTISNLTAFTLPNNEDTGLPITIQPGGYYDLQVRFIDTSSTGSKLRTATLTVNSSDPTNPTTVVQLRGIWQAAPEGSSEPARSDIYPAFGLSANIPAVMNSQYIQAGDEVLSYYWQSDGSPQVYVRQLAAYHGCNVPTGQSAGIQITGPGGGANGHAGLYCQSVLPPSHGGVNPMQLLVKPTSPNFEIIVSGYSTNRCEGVTNCNLNGLRLFPVMNPAGQPIPGTYLALQDYVDFGCGPGNANCDYNDNLYLITGIAPSNVIIQPTLTIEKTGSAALAPINTNFTYLLNITNTSTVQAVTSTIVDNLPAGMTFVSATTGYGTCSHSSGTVTCTLNNIPALSTAVVSIVVQQTIAGTVTNQASVTTGTLTVSDSETTQFYDTATTGTITIAKNADPDDPAAFTFTGGLGTFQLSDTGGAAPTPVNLQINFGPSSVVVGGYTNNNGAPYTFGGSGWVTETSRFSDTPEPLDLVTNAVTTGALPATTGTYIEMQNPSPAMGDTPTNGAWIYDNLPNGAYSVTVSVGDSHATNSVHVINVNGINLIPPFVPSGAVNSSTRFTTGTGTFFVTDGRLVVDAAGGTNTKINYIHIQSVASATNSQTFANIPTGTYTITEQAAAGWSFDNATCVGGTGSTSGNSLNITLGAGENITCTVNNEQIDGSAITIDIAPDTQTLYIGDDASFTVTVTNNGIIELNNVSVSSNLGVCNRTIGTLTAGQTVTYNCTTTNISGSFNHTATASGAPAGLPVVSDTDTATVTATPRPQLTVTRTIGSDGTTTLPATSTVDYNDDLPFTVTPDAGFAIGSVTANGVPLTPIAPGQYQLDNILVDTDVDITFIPVGTRTVTFATDGNGTVNQPASQTVTVGTDLPFTVIPVPGYVVDTVTANGVPLTAINTNQYELTNISADTDVQVTFRTVMTVCTPYSTQACDTIPVPVTSAAPYCLAFNGGAGGLSDTGFTMADPPVNFVAPFTTPTNSQVPGYEPSRLTVSGGNLSILTTQGIQQQANNSQVNGLGVGVSMDAVTIIETTIVGDLPASGSQQQIGLWFGRDYDNYVKFVVLANSSGIERLQLMVEDAGTIQSDTYVMPASLTATDRLTLSMTINPNTNLVSVNYRLNGGTLTAPFAFTRPFPASLINGAVLPDAAGSVSFAGIFASQWFTGTSFTATTSSFCVQETPSQAYTIATSSVGVGTVSPTGNVTVSRYDDRTFTFTPGANQRVERVIVDGVEVPGSLNMTSYTFDSVTANHTLQVIFNQVPDAIDDTATTNEDTLVNINVLANDVDNEPLTIFDVTQPANGTVQIIGGQIRYTPNANFNGTDTFTYTIEDGQGLTDTATVTVTVTPVNDAPIAQDDTATTNEETPVVINVRGNDTDVENNPLTVTNVTAPTNGTVTIINGGLDVRYTPNADFFGTDTFDYTIDDGNGGTATATVTVTVNNVNDASVAQDDTATTNEDTAVTANVLANDNDVDGDTLVIFLINSATNGTAVIVGNQIQFTPAANFSGTATVVYTVSDNNGGTDTATLTITVNPINDAPDAVNDNRTTPEETPITIDVLFNDTDVEGDTLTITNISTPANGTAALVGGQIEYTPDADFAGTDTFTYTIDDGNGGTDTATVTIIVTNVNDAPIANDDAIATNEDTPVTINVRGNDTDADGDTLTITNVTQPAPGTGTTNISAGQIVYTPPANYSGTATFSYTISDGNGGTDTAQVTVTVNAVNDPPVAVNDTATTLENNAVDISVLVNDSDVEGAVTVTAVTQPANGTVTIINGGTQVQYTPNPGFNNPDSFTYTITDSNGATATATVNVTVVGVNDIPVANDDNATTNEDTPVTINVRGNDTDADGDVLTITATTPPTNGTITIISGQIQYTPNANYHGSDSFTYTISDGNGGTDTATVNITVTSVNDVPNAVNDTVTTVEETAVAFNVLVNDTDADGDTLIVTGLTGVGNGTATFTAGGDITFTPAANFAGTETFTYTVSDGNGGTDTATVTVTVTHVNDNPTAQNNNYNMQEDSTQTFQVLNNDSDPDGDSLIIISYTNPSNGTILGLFNGNTRIRYRPNANYFGPDSFTYTISDGNGGTATATVNVTVNAVNDNPVANTDTVTTVEDTPITIDALANDTDVENHTLTITAVGTTAAGTATIVANQVVFTPNPNFTGSISFSYTIRDNGSPNRTATGTINVNITPVNDPPIAVTDNVNTLEDNAVTVNVLTNDVDVDGDSLTITAVGSTPNGTTSFTGTTVTFIPALNYFGLATFTYTIVDGSGGTSVGTVNVTVNSVNDVPVVVADTASTPEETPVLIDVLDNDTDAEGNTLTVSNVTQGANGTVTIVGDEVRYLPNTNFVGTDTFTYTASDGNGGNTVGTVTVTVSNLNDDPAAVNDTAVTDENVPVLISVLTNDTDPDGDTLILSNVSGATNGTAIIVGNQVQFTPNTNFNGTAALTYTVTDPNGGTDTATVAITVNSVNEAPIAVNDTGTTPEDTPITLSVLLNDTDGDGDTLSVQSVTQPANGTVTFTGTTVTFTPNANFNGVVTFTYTAADGNGGTDDGTVTISVTAVNDAPDAVNDTATAAEDSTVTIDVLANDADPDGNPLTITLVTQGTNGTVTINGTQINYVPNANYNGADSFTYTITDGNSETDTATVNVTVTPVNDDPVANNDIAGTIENTAVAIVPLTNDTDIDGDPLNIDSFTQPTDGTVTQTGNTFTFMPDTGFLGTTTFTYTITDGNGSTATGTITVTVTAAPNIPPNAVNDAVTTDEDTGATLTVLANDTDANGDTLTITGVTQPANGSVTHNGTTVTFMPNANFNGTTTFDYTITDGSGGTDTATVTVTVNPVNDLPVANNNFVTIAEDGTATINVLANDNDPDGDTLTIINTTPPANGTITVNAAQQVIYTPNAHFHGTDTFTYVVDDGSGGTDTATVTITVASVNDVPVATDDTSTTDEDTPVLVNVLLNDTDADGDVLTIASATATNGTAAIIAGQVQFTPAANFNGAATVTYTINDGNGGTAAATITITVNAVNDAPTVTNDTAGTLAGSAVTINVLANDSDVEGDTLTIDSTTQGISGTVTINAGQVVYTPNAGFVGTDTFTVTISDGNGGLATSTVTVTVNPVPNTAPNAVNDTAATAEDTPFLIPVLANDTDADGDILSITGITQPVSGGTVTVIGTQIQFTPTANFNGTRNFTYTISDGRGGTDTATVAVTVTAVNDAPVANNDTSGTTVNTPVTINVLANDTDADGNTLTIDSITQPPSGTATINAGQVVYTPNTGFIGTDTFTVTISDGSGGTATSFVTVNVNPLPNTPPAASSDTVTTDEDTPLMISVLTNDSDADGHTLTITNVSTPAHGTATIIGTQVQYVPDANFNGTDTFTYTISDGSGGTDTAAVNITIDAVNDDPVANADTGTVTAGNSVTLDVLANDTDAEGDTLAIASVTQGANGTVMINAGQVVYTPALNFAGIDTFTVTIEDGSGGTATSPVTVTVNTAPNTPPNAAGDIITTAEDTTATISVLANDTDADGDTLTIVSITQPANGTASIVGNQIQFTPNANFNGTTSFTYIIGDGRGGTATAAVDVTVTAVNDNPYANHDNGTAISGQPVTITVLSNDNDIDGNTLTITAVTQGSNGTVTHTASSITYTPNAGFTGTDNFTYTISDGNGGTAPANVTVVVNAAAVASLSVNITTNTPNTPAGSDVTFTIIIQNTGTAGATGINVTLTNTGGLPDNTCTIPTFDLTPGAQQTFTCTDTGVTTSYSRTVTVIDAANNTVNGSANVTVATAANQPPVATNDTAQAHTGQVIGIPVTANDFDPENALNLGSLTVTSQPAVGFISGVDTGTGVITYNAPQTAGTVTFVYSICDDQNQCATATVAVQVTEQVINPPQTPPDNTVASAPTNTAPAVAPIGQRDPAISVFDPGFSKIGFLSPGQLGVNGEQVEWFVTIVNTGAETGRNVVVTDTLRSELRITNVTTSQGTANVSGQAVTFNIGDLAPGERVQAVITTTVVSGGAEVTNEATLTADNLVGGSRTVTARVVTTLPNTGESPWSILRPLLFLLIGLATAGASLIIVKKWRFERRKPI